MADFIIRYLDLVPSISKTDIVEILIIAFLIYQLMRWFQSSKAWALLKGIIVLVGLTCLAAIFRLNAILWLVDKTLNVGIIAVIIVFQPELRKALEELGTKNIFANIFSFEEMRAKAEQFDNRTVSELVKAVFELGKAKTGALIVIEKNVSLKEYERTGIVVDGLVTSQLLINIFEHNTPLHDGAVLIRGNRIVAATCYLPLSDNLYISKELGTRHRAAIGISEVTDSLTIIASEETGDISLAQDGVLMRDIDSDQLKIELLKLQYKNPEQKRFKLLKGRQKDEKKVDE